MYPSVHYVLRANQETELTAELQVRTLMEEVWGEVSHRVDYPTATQNRACRDQLKVLARLTSGCTRLVDSIFKSHRE
jgi:ppGpp synthetase/RelA/SpoT-type nucleotidyltranferase